MSAVTDPRRPLVSISEAEGSVVHSPRAMCAGRCGASAKPWRRCWGSRCRLCLTKWQSCPSTLPRLFGVVCSREGLPAHTSHEQGATDYQARADCAGGRASLNRTVRSQRASVSALCLCSTASMPWMTATGCASS